MFQFCRKMWSILPVQIVQIFPKLGPFKQFHWCSTVLSKSINRPAVCLCSSFFNLLLQDSGRWSLSPGDDFSSGVFSYNSQPDVQVFSVDLLSHTQLPPPCCFEGEINLSPSLLLNDLMLYQFVKWDIICTYSMCISPLWLAQGLMSASKTSTGEASASERRAGWRWATLLLESVIRWGRAHMCRDRYSC